MYTNIHVYYNLIPQNNNKQTTPHSRHPNVEISAAKNSTRTSQSQKVSASERIGALTSRRLNVGV